jgi:hypothetical protein
MALCKDGCERVARSGGWRSSHYRRWRAGKALDTRYGAISDTKKARTGRLSPSGSLVRSLPSARLRSLRRWCSYAPLDCGSWHHWPGVAGSRWPGVALA